MKHQKEGSQLFIKDGIKSLGWENQRRGTKAKLKMVQVQNLNQTMTILTKRIQSTREKKSAKI